MAHDSGEAMQVAALRFERVGKTYAASIALDGFTLSVAAGECFGLIGANGAGKTTLLKCLLDFCEPDTGDIKIFGVSQRLTQARARLVYLPERFNPPYYLNGREYLKFMACMHGNAYDEQAAADACRALDLDPVALAKPVRAYSKGMNQKLGLAACLLSGKELCVFDEPTTGLDPRARILLKRKLKALRESGKTIFFTSHTLADVEEMCSRLAVIDGGKLRFTGTPAELTQGQNAANLEQAFMALIEPVHS
jgi:ABC-2 type transport system ATP-binding protein